MTNVSYLMYIYTSGWRWSLRGLDTEVAQHMRELRVDTFDGLFNADHSRGGGSMARQRQRPHRLLTCQHTRETIKWLNQISLLNIGLYDMSMLHFLF